MNLEPRWGIHVLRGQKTAGLKAGKTTEKYSMPMSFTITMVAIQANHIWEICDQKTKFGKKKEVHSFRVMPCKPV